MKNLYQKIFLLIVILASLNFTYAVQLSSISQYGITWYFDSPHECGQFVTGDWWVVGPVTITHTDPAQIPGRNGSELDRTPVRYSAFDNREQLKVADYKESLRVTFPLTVSGFHSLSTTKSSPEYDCTDDGGHPETQDRWGDCIQSGIQSFAVLTIVEGPVPEGTFRPSYLGGAYGEFINMADVDLNVLPHLPVLSTSIDMDDLIEHFERPWLDGFYQCYGTVACAKDNGPNYGVQVSNLTSAAAVALMQDIPKLQELAVLLIQRGIDIYQGILNGASWPPDGGHMTGRKWPVLFAGKVLNHQGMLNIGYDYVASTFQEDCQTYYRNGDVNDPWWGIRHCTEPGNDTVTKYRTNNSETWPGMMVTAMALGLRDEWNHESFFDYVDRWIADEGVADGIAGVHKVYIQEFWNTYRNNLPAEIPYGSVTTIHVTGVSVSPATLTLNPGQSSVLTETVSPVNATNKYVTWTSSNDFIAVVDENGLVTAVAQGNAIITATTIDSSFTATCAVTVNPLSSDVNLALGKTVSTTSDDGTNVGANIVDDNTVSRWSANTYPESATIDLGEECTISRFELHTFDNRAYQYIIEVSPDGTNYTQLVDRSANTSGIQPITDYVNGTGRYIKITVNGASGYTGTWISLSELKVFGSTGVSVTSAYYCDPVNGSMSNNGSESTPWSSLEDVINAGKTFADGDVIYLMNGNHGHPVITSSNPGNVTITKYPGHSPEIRRVVFTGADNWTLKEVKITSNGAFIANPNIPLNFPVYPVDDNDLVYILNSNYITVDNCLVCSVDDNSVWTTTDDWNDYTWNGLIAKGGSNISFINNTIKNVNFGAGAGGKYTVANFVFRNNVVENFCGDGLQFGCSYALIESNVIKNGFKVNGNHIDLIQGVLDTVPGIGTQIKGNILLAYTDPNQPFLEYAQGIGLFEGVSKTNYEIENNLIVTNVNNALAITNGINCNITNNTVVNMGDLSIVPALIIIYGEQSADNIIRNNICNAIENNTSGIVENNLEITFSNYSTYFIDHENYDFHLKSGPAIDGGTSTGAPAIDLDGVARPQINGYDIGCYEFAGTLTSVIGVTLTPENLNLEIGQTANLTATVEPTNATNQNISWVSSNPSVAIVDNGYVVAASAGTATITVTTEDGNFTDVCNITVTTPTGDYNLALYKPVTVTSEDLPANPGTNLVNGNIADDSRWSTEGYPQSAEIDLGEDCNISSLQLYTYSGRAYQYIIEASPDGTNYTQLVDRSANTSGIQPITDYVNGTGRYIKITVNGASGYTGTWISINELMVFGTTLAVTTPVNGVQLDISSLNLNESESYDLTETVSPPDATDKSVIWSSSDTSIATVDANGLVSAVAQGSCTITVTTNDNGFTANCVVTVQGAQQPITTLYEAEDFTANSGVAVRSDHPGYTGTGYADYGIWAEWNNVDGGSGGTATFTFRYAVDGSANRSCNLIVNGTIVGNLTFAPTGSWSTWSTESIDAELIAGLNTVRLEKSGSYGPNLDNFEVSSSAISVTGVSLDQTSVSLDVGQLSDLTETVSPANATDKSVTWSSSNTSVATVETNGLVEAVGEGSCTIIVTTNNGGFTANCAVTVSIPVTGVSVSPTSLSIEEGQSSGLAATVSPANATDQSVTWISSQTSIATVDANGVVSAISAGDAIITATTNNGFTANCNVTVTAASQPYSETIYAPISDRDVRSSGTIGGVNDTITRVGGASTGVDAALVIPFQLPEIQSGDMVLAADVSIQLKRVAGTPEGNVDVYGLPYRSTDDVYATDFYQGPYGGDAGTTPIQDDFALNVMPVETLLSTDDIGDANLAGYINAQYTAGAQADDFIFIRLNPDVADVSNYRFWEFYTANSSKVPVLTLEIGSNPSKNKYLTKVDKSIPDQIKSSIWPNPLNSGIELQIVVSGFDTNKQAQLKIIDLMGKVAHADKFYTDDVGQAKLGYQLNSLAKGVYILSIECNQAYVKHKLFVK